MERKHLILPILLGFAGVVAFLFFLIWRPFFAPITWAAVFAILFRPVNSRLSQKIPFQAGSAVIMTTLVVLIIIVPMVLLSIALIAEVVQTYDLVQRWFQSGEYNTFLKFFEEPFFLKLKERIGQIVDSQQLDLFSLVSSVMQRISSFAVSQATGIVQNFSRTMFSFILMVFTLFYFFKDGEKISSFLRDLIPLSSERRKEITNQFSEVITATVLGDLAVALMQGVLGGFAFWILGVPSPIFWGTVMAFLSIFPVIGAPIVYIPAGLIMIAQDSVIRGVILLIWGSLIVSQIDNFLRPMLISGRTKLHTLVLFFSILGGIYLFGFLGIIMGPVIAALFLTLVKMYRLEFLENPDGAEMGTPPEVSDER